MAALVCASYVQAGDELPLPGIRVNKVKLYNSGMLQQRLRVLYSNLAASAGISPDQAQSAIGNLQQFQETATHLGVSVTTSPVPNPADATKILNPPTTSTGSPVGLSGRTGTPGLTSFQNLVQQLNYQYEILNLQFLLSRALNDSVDLTTGNPRPTVLVGVPITIVSDSAYRNRVAEVMVTVTSGDGDNQPQVVALMPQSRTYNVQKIVRGSRAFSLGALSTFLGIGVDSQRQSDNIYLVQDYDTVALNGADVAGKGAQFGWRFKPVLESDQIEPGDRFLLVALSLPPGEAQELTVSTTTRWRMYDRKSRSAGAVDRKLNQGETPSVTKIPLNFANWAPVVQKTPVVALNTDGKTANVLLRGARMLEDLTLMLDGSAVPFTSYGSSAIQFTVPVRDLFEKSVDYVGLDGQRRALGKASGIEIGSDPMLQAVIEETFGDEFIEISCTQACVPELRTLFQRELLVLVGDKVFGFKEDDITREGEHYRLQIPFNQTAGVKAVTLIAPFHTFKGGEPLRFSLPLKKEPLFDVSTVTQVLAPKDFVQYVIRGRNLRDLKVYSPGKGGIADKIGVASFTVESAADTTKAALVAGDPVTDVPTGVDSALLVKMKVEDLKKGMILTLSREKGVPNCPRQGNADPTKPCICDGPTTEPDHKCACYGGHDPCKKTYSKMVELPKTKELKELLTPPEKVELKLAPVDQYFEGMVPLEGTLAKDVISVELGSVRLTPVQEGENFFIQLPKKLTAKPGNRSFMVTITRKGKEPEKRPLVLEVRPAPEGKGKGG